MAQKPITHTEIRKLGAAAQKSIDELRVFKTKVLTHLEEEERGETPMATKKKRTPAQEAATKRMLAGRKQSLRSSGASANDNGRAKKVGGPKAKKAKRAKTKRVKERGEWQGPLPSRAQQRRVAKKQRSLRQGPMTAAEERALIASYGSSRVQRGPISPKQERAAVRKKKAAAKKRAVAREAKAFESYARSVQRKDNAADRKKTKKRKSSSGRTPAQEKATRALVARNKAKAGGATRKRKGTQKSVAKRGCATCKHTQAYVNQHGGTAACVACGKPHTLRQHWSHRKGGHSLARHTDHSYRVTRGYESAPRRGAASKRKAPAAARRSSAPAATAKKTTSVDALLKRARLKVCIGRACRTLKPSRSR